jgi:hypothetical protein
MFLVIDNFTPNPLKVRQSALHSGFGTWKPNKGEVGSSVYDGMNFWGDHALMLKGLVKAVGKGVYPNDMFFRVTNLDTEAAYVHSDRQSGDYTAIVYLSEHDEKESGTGFYRHRETGWTTMPSFEELRQTPEFFNRLKTQMVEGGDDTWALVRFVPGKFNRAVIFDAPLFHARHPRHGFGSTPEDGRLIWATHFVL